MEGQHVAYISVCPMKLLRRFHIELPEPGVLVYREGADEYLFPVYEEDDELVLVAWPTSQRRFLILSWMRIPRTFSERDSTRIKSNIIEHFNQAGIRIRILEPAPNEQRGLLFHAELFGARATASELLESAGFTWFCDYSSIDLLHEELGLEVCGIREESSLEAIADAMRDAFPHWHYHEVCHKDYGRDPGWKFALHMFPCRCSDNRYTDAE